MPAAVVAGKSVDLVHNHRSQIAEQAAGIDVGRDQHHLQRLWCGEQAIGRIAQYMPPGGRGHVAMPERRPPAQERAVPLEANVEVVQQGLDRADVEQAQAGPVLRQHAGGQREEGRLGLAARRGRQHDHVLPGQDARDDLLLERSKLPPSHAVDDVVLDRRMELVEVAHRFQLDFIDVRGAHRLPLNRRQFGLSDGQGIVLPWVEVRELVNAVQHIGDQLLQKNPRGYADFAAQAAGHGLGQIPDVAVVARRRDPLAALACC